MMSQVQAVLEKPYVHELSPARLRAHQAEVAAILGLETAFRDTLADGSPGPELVIVPPGVFDMGAVDDERGFGEQPRRHVTIDAPFALGRFCVTAEEFHAFAKATGFSWSDHLIRTEGRQPVTNIDRAQAQAYLDWLGTEAGHRYRLPTEAEWEYACRAGSATRYCFGDELGCGEANTGSFRLEGRSSQGWRRFLPFCAPLYQAIDVGCYPANLWGLHDMHGNVWEFTSDAWVGPIDALHSAKPGRDGLWFVTKGGSWFESAWQARSAARKPRRINELDMNLGFRVLRETP
ncbi:MAG: formylglycine-generating enzyme family protein [Thiobacillus sp.]|nr:formylglycine-generating enzyme family protein [Thiobacillus sp.]